MWVGYLNRKECRTGRSASTLLSSAHELLAREKHSSNYEQAALTRTSIAKGSGRIKRNRGGRGLWQARRSVFIFG